MLRKYRIHRAIVPVAVLGLGLLPSISRASITFTMNSVQTTTNAGDFQQVDATTINALNLNQNQALGQNTPILKIVTDQAATIQGGGQASIVAADPTKPFGDVVITPINPPIKGFTTLELNPFTAPGSGTTGQFYLLATDDNGTVFDSRGGNPNNLFTFDQNGQNRFAAVASNGETITKLEMIVTPPNADILKQFRLNYVLGDPVAAPEPSTFALALSGLTAIGVAAIRRKTRSADV
jgi:hypothetical protein